MKFENNIGQSILDTPNRADLAGPPPQVIVELLRLLGTADVLVGVYDPNDTLCYGNAAFRNAYGVAHDTSPTWEQIMRHNFAAGLGAALDTKDLDNWIASALSRRGKAAARQFESDLIDGR